MRYLVAPLRVVILVLHILDGLLISGLLFPLLDQRRRNRIIGAWSRGLVRICAMRLVVSGRPLDPLLAHQGVVPGVHGHLMLANHISWIDVFALLGTIPSKFVAKSEIGRWPLVGLLVTLVGTLYIERGRRHAVAAMNQRMRDRLKSGESVVVFAEGTTTDGFSLLPFHSNLIPPALEVGCDIWPVALHYTERGKRSAAPSFVGEMGLVTSMWNILVARDLAIEISFLEPIPTNSESNRHRIAHEAHVRIAEQLGLPPAAPRAHLNPGRAPAPADTEPGARFDPATPAH